jgi:hypothetical protein
VRSKTLLVAVAVALALFALAFAGYRYRRSYIRGLFEHGPGGAAAPALPGGRDGEPVPRAARVRVVLLDGVDAATARGLPAYSALCDRGIDATIDVGFPTVSLSVQHALWTGLTQQQTGVEFVIAALPSPPDGDTPGQVPGSVAIAEAHPEIIGSFGFERCEVPDDGAFDATATAAVAGGAPLVFVHVLRADAAGHTSGRDSAAFRDAAGTADASLAALVAADTRADTRWFVLSDHGHRAGGGHGGAERSIRRVRACIAGALPDGLRASPGAELHVVDLARAVAESAGARISPQSAGRPLAVALAAPAFGDDALPSPEPAQWATASLLLAIGIALTAWASRRRWWALPWWWPVAYASVLLIEEAPSLSVPMIYKPLGQTIYYAALPGLCALAVLAALALRRDSPARVAVAQLAIPIAIAAAAAVLAGAMTPGPPLMPGWTARASVFLVLSFTAAVVVALAALATAVRPAFDRTTRDRTRDSDA